MVLGAALAWLPLNAASTEVATGNCAPAAAAPRGAWEKEGGGTQILFQDDQIVLRKAGALSVATILKREPCKLLVLYQGLQSSWKITSNQDALTLQADEPLTLRQLSSTPSELDINLAVLPAPKAIPADEVRAVGQELVARRDKDQAAVTDPALKAKRPEIMADNLRYLREVTRRVGWIDIPRFGKPAAAAAILIAKHGSDLLLMKAALPIVERDVKENGGSGEMFSVLYDELQITLGHRQRYGTQFMPDAKGKPFVLPLEDPTKVDVYRKEIGILSFKDYLKLVSDNMGGASIRVAGNDE
jgi:hypothetical protein